MLGGPQSASPVLVTSARHQCSSPVRVTGARRTVSVRTAVKHEILLQAKEITAQTMVTLSEVYGDEVL